MSLPSRFVPQLLSAWFAAVIVWTWPSFQWQLDYYKTPGPAFHKAILIAAPLVLLTSLAYAWLRPKARLQRLEPWALLALTSPLALLRPLPALAAAVVALGCFVLGCNALRLARIAPSATVESVFLRFGLGFATASALLFWLGVAGWFHRWAFAALAVILGAWGWRELAEPWRAARRAIRTWATADELASPLVGVAAFFAMLVTVSGVALMLAPPIAYDAVNYHLPLAQAYAEVGTLQAALGEPYTFYPQSFESLLSWAHGLGGVEAARLLAVFFFTLALAGAWSVARRLEASRAAAALGLAAALIMPAIHFSGVTVKNDTAIASYCLASLLCYFGWREDGRPGWIVLGALFFAAAFGVKHTALFAAIGLAPLGLHALWRSRGARLRLAAAAALIWLLAAGVWHIRAAILTGNPTYPYNARRMTKATVEGNAEPGAQAAKPWALLASVPQTFVELHRDGSLVYESILPAPAGIFLALLLPAPLLLRTRPKHGAAAALFVYGSLAVWAVAMTSLRDAVNAHMTLRYVLPAFLLWPILLAAPATSLYERFPRAGKLAMVAALAYAFLLPWTGLLIVENSGAQARFLAGRLSERDYLAGAMLPFPAIEAAANAAMPGESALSFQGCAALFYPQPWKFQCRRPGDWSDPLATISSELRKDGYRFLILEVEDEAFASRLPARTEVIFRDDHYVTYRLGAQ